MSITDLTAETGPSDTPRGLTERETADLESALDDLLSKADEAALRLIEYRIFTTDVEARVEGMERLGDAVVSKVREEVARRDEQGIR